MRDGMVSLGGRRFRVLLDTYRQRDLADFSPRASLPTQSINQSELLLYQPLVMTDWRHGFGFMWMTDAMGYMKSEGGIDTRFGGMIASAPKRNVIYHRGSRDSDTTRPQFANGCVPVFSSTYQSFLFLYGDGVFNILGGTLYEMPSGISGEIFDALSTTRYVFFASIGRLRKFDLSNQQWSDAGVNSNSVDYHWLRAHNGYIFAGKSNTNQVYYGTKEDLSDLHGDPNDDPDVIYVGYAGYPTLKATQFGQELLVAKPDGIFTIGQDMVARRVVDFSSELSSSLNFNLFTVYNGMVYFNIKNKIYMWNGARMQDVSIPRFNDEFPYVEVAQITAGASAGGYLYVLANWKPEGSNDYITSLFAHDGVGWHKLHDFIEFPQTTPYAWVDSSKNYYFISPVPVLSAVYDRNSLVVGIPVSVNFPVKSSYYKFVIDNSQSPVSPFAPSGVWYSPRLDMGFRRVTKSAVQLQLEVQKASSSTPIQVSVRLDDNPTWYNLGTVTVAGIHHFNFSSVNPVTKTAEFRYMVIRLTFTGTDTATAIVEGITLRFLMRPNVFYGWNMDIVASQEYTFDGQVFETSPQETLTYLKTLRDSKAPIEFIDLQGGVYHGYISSVNVQSLELFEPATDSTTNIESVININFVEAK